MKIAILERVTYSDPKRINEHLYIGQRTTEAYRLTEGNNTKLFEYLSCSNSKNEEKFGGEVAVFHRILSDLDEKGYYIALKPSSLFINQKRQVLIFFEKESK